MQNVFLCLKFPSVLNIVSRSVYATVSLVPSLADLIPTTAQRHNVTIVSVMMKLSVALFHHRSTTSTGSALVAHSSFGECEVSVDSRYTGHVFLGTFASTKK